MGAISMRFFCPNHGLYPLVNSHSYGKLPFIIGRSTINGSISMAMLVYQRVHSPTIGILRDNSRINQWILLDHLVSDKANCWDIARV